MKSLIGAIAVAAVIVPAVSFAQSNQPVTRAQVREDLAQLEKAGYNPRDWMNFPDNIQRAEAVVAEQKAGANTGYGAATSGTSQSGQ